ncbi:MAG: M16 family metallopeptidase, partial [Planctomycetota bacterium]
MRSTPTDGAITREDLYEHYRRFYSPDNATLVLVGDLEPESTLNLVRRRFGHMSAVGRAHEVRAVEPEQCGERRVEVRRPGKAVYWMCACHIPAFGHDDRLPLMVLEAVLSGARPLGWSGGGFLGKSARLHDALVNRKQVAVYASGYARFMKDPGLFVLSMMLRDGVKPEKAEAAMFSEIRKLQDKGPKPAELKKAVNQVRAQVEYAHDGITANAYTIGNLDSFDALDELETLVDRVATVSAEDVVRVAQTYFLAQNRTVGVFIPEGEADAPAGGPPPHGAHSWSLSHWWRPPLPTGVAPLGEADNVAWLSPGAPWFAASVGAGRVALPAIQKRVLDCGTTVFGIENRDSHCVAVAGFLRGGASLDPPDSTGLAYLTANMLDQGTSRKNCRQIAAVTDKIGASLSFGAGADSTNLGGKCLPRGLPKVLALLRECLSDLAAPEPELEKVRQQTVTAMKADRDSTRWLAA